MWLDDCGPLISLTRPLKICHYIMSCTIYSTKKSRTTLYHPQGLVRVAGSSAVWIVDAERAARGQTDAEAVDTLLFHFDDRKFVRFNLGIGERD